MKKLAFIFIIFNLITFLPTKAFSWCSAPSTPYDNVSSKPSIPSKPYCLNSYSNDCDQWEIDNYNREVENYNYALRRYQNDLEQYVRDLQDYVNEASEYANCEIRNLD